MSEAKKGLPGWAKLVIAVVVLGGAIFALKYFHLSDKLLGAKDWIAGLGAIGIVVYIALYAGLTLVGGATPLTLIAGAIYGFVGGVAVVSPASVLGATMAFLLGRFALRKSVEAKVASNPKFAAVEKAVGTNGFKIVGLLRLSPAFPFTFLNYGLGLTTVSLKDYVLASWLGMLPGTAMYVYFGFLGGAATTSAASGSLLERLGASVSNVKECISGGASCDRTSALSFALTAVGGIATVVVTIVVTRIARKALAEAVDKKPAEQLSPSERPTVADA